jgi:hypothetical protein
MVRIAIFLGYLIVMSALSVQVAWITLVFANPEKAREISLGTTDDGIFVSSVKNKVVMGSLAGNRNLEFGVQNILDEFIVEEKDLVLNPYALKTIEVEILYLDVLKTQSNLSVFHKNTESVVIRMRGKLLNKGKVIKTVVVEESADEVSMSTLLIDEGGKFNQTNLSTALKKSCNSLVNKLL